MNHRQHPAPRPTTVTRSGPLTWVQQWHWFEHTIPAPRRVNPTPLADHCQVPPGATVDDVLAALASLTARHEALRTTVDPLEPVQHVHRPEWAPPPVDCVEVADVDAGTLETATAALAARPIDPERNPPWLARVLLVAGEPRAVLVATHHVLIDGWGLAVLIGQLHELLRGAAPARTPVAHPLDTLAAQPLERARAAEREWLTRLATNPTNVLAPFGGRADGAGRHRLQHRSVEAYDDLDRVARRYRVSAEVVVLAALAHEVAGRTGEHRFLASVVVSNRARAALRGSVGVRALTVPVQIDLRPGAAFGEVAASVAAACAAAYRHGQYRVAELVAAQARMDRRRGVVAVHTIEYNCYSWPRDYLVPGAETRPDGPATWIRSEPDEPCDTLYVDLSRDAGVVTLDVTVGDHLLDAEQAVALPVRLCALLRALAEGARCPVPARALAPAAPGWWRAPQGWVCLPRLAEVVRAHPGVLDVTVTPAGETGRGGKGPRPAGENGRGGEGPALAGGTGRGGEGPRPARETAREGYRPALAGEAGRRKGEGPRLVARARVVPGVTSADLHRHVLDHLGEVPGLLAPDGYVLSPAGLGSGPLPDRPGAAGSAAGTPRLTARPPATEAERALAAAVAAVAAPDGLPAGSSDNPVAVDMNGCLADHGVTLVAVPRLLALLHRSGHTGIASDELAGTASLGHLAAALEPLRDRAHRGGETSP
ncbi:condensation domain-containing protein [Streptomyces sp. DSM 41014]|uniref:Condensation domain-containing protein n=1 Tax=Streptomyces hintoniae TaxID=3075521 RepID=A0ABU2ULD1_9ACTN|nr:condensation domain-containing protein [Streptomyces sp. DSM 41014]MDT0474079.1 condensation domain-containing protein [Streptomyces sp. DSM 41014]